MTQKTQIETGGAAFPRPASEFTKNGTLPDGNNAVDEQDGMTLRDYFAAKAMQALLTYEDTSASDSDRRTLAVKCYAISDAMLVAKAGLI